LKICPPPSPPRGEGILADVDLGEKYEQGNEEKTKIFAKEEK
jgi:hypothetical protein